MRFLLFAAALAAIPVTARADACDAWSRQNAAWSRLSGDVLAQTVMLATLPLTADLSDDAATQIDGIREALLQAVNTSIAETDDIRKTDAATCVTRP